MVCDKDKMNMSYVLEMYSDVRENQPVWFGVLKKSQEAK